MQDRAFRLSLPWAALLFACDSGSTRTTGADVGSSSQALISDGAHSGGTPGFYFLPPLVPQPRIAGVFERRLSPVVRVDRIDPKAGAILENVATFTATTRGREKVRRHPHRGFYIVRWHTDKYSLDPAASYRIQVLAGGRQLGFADVDVVETRREVRNVNTNDFIPLKKGHTLPIKFRVEKHAVDKDGDGVFDWEDNCPTVANAPTGTPPDPRPSVSNPPRGCDYEAEECDPGEQDCNPAAVAQTDSDGDAKGDACECLGVVCVPRDQCHEAGLCDSTTGACRGPAMPDGTACDDADLCTQVDSCEAGTCVGDIPITCTALDDCHVAGTCSPDTGVCTNPAKMDGVTCSDSNSCTQRDTCSGGKCVGDDPVLCMAADQCHLAGSCDPQTGSCSNAASPDGTSCNDDNPCSQVDVCEGGTCVGTNPVLCDAPDPCHGPGICSPLTGACTKPLVFDGTTCAAAPDGRPMQPGSAVVMFRRSTPVDLQNAVISASPAASSHAHFDDVWEIRAGDVSLDDVMSYFTGLDCVKSVEPNYVVFSHLSPADPYFNRQWNLQNIRVPLAWDFAIATPAVSIAILDSGIFGDDASFDAPDGLPGHPDLRGRLLLPSIDLYPSSPDGHDDFYGDGHGTLMAGIASALTGNSLGMAGTAYSAALINVRVMQTDGTGLALAFADGIAQAAERGAKVINMSFGAPGSCPSFVQSAVDRAWSSGAVLVAAAGDISTSVLGGATDYPANCQNVISVTASDQLNGLVPGAPSLTHEVDLAAPGTADILSTDHNGEISPVGASGTSQAAAQVSGVAALVWAAGAPTNEAVVDRLFSTGRLNVPAASYARYGLVDALAAVTTPDSKPRSFAPIPLSPYEGEMVGAAPEFQWTEVLGASDYQFFIYDPFQRLRHSVQYPTGAPCRGGICRMPNPFGFLYNGLWSWTVEAIMPTADSFLSAETSFKVGPSVSVGVNVSSGGRVHSADGSVQCATPGCGFSLSTGGAVELIADDVSSPAFLGWSGECSIVTGRSCWVFGNVAKAVTANFFTSVPGDPPSGLVLSPQRSGMTGRAFGFSTAVASGTNVTYAWDFGDGGSGVGASPNHTYTAAGRYTVTVTASNPLGSTSATASVQVENEPSIAKIYGSGFIDDDGRFWSVGLTYPGDGTIGPFPSPVLAEIPSRVVKIAGQRAARHVLALTDDGTLWAWGYGAPVGVGIDRAAQPTPQALSLTGITSIGTGSNHSVASSPAGIWVWGRGDQVSDPLGLGSRSTVLVSSPVSIGFQGVALAGSLSSVFIRPDGAFLMTGLVSMERPVPPDFSFAVYSTVPVAVPALAGMSAVSSGDDEKKVAFGGHFLAIDRNGNIHSWGENDHGELGDGTVTMRTDPVQIGLNHIVKVGVEGFCSMALSDDGRVWNWGAFVDGVTRVNASPLLLPGIADAVDIQGCRTVLRSDGTVWGPGPGPTSALVRLFGVPRPPSVCGDGTCEGGFRVESCQTCSTDCPCIVDGGVCQYAFECASNVCGSYFQDADGDGYGSTSSKLCGSVAPVGYAVNSGDCCDADPNTFPNQLEFFAQPRAGCGGFDYDCNDTEEQASSCLEVSGVRSCPGCVSSWVDMVPGCGEEGWYSIRAGGNPLCFMGLSGPRLQACR